MLSFPPLHGARPPRSHRSWPRGGYAHPEAGDARRGGHRRRPARGAQAAPTTTAANTTTTTTRAIRASQVAQRGGTSASTSVGSTPQQEPRDGGRTWRAGLSGSSPYDQASTTSRPDDIRVPHRLSLRPTRSQPNSLVTEPMALPYTPHCRSAAPGRAATYCAWLPRLPGQRTAAEGADSRTGRFRASASDHAPAAGRLHRPGRSGRPSEEGLAGLPDCRTAGQRHRHRHRHRTTMLAPHLSGNGGANPQCRIRVGYGCRSASHEPTITSCKQFPAGERKQD